MLVRIRNLVARSTFLRFLISGGANTIATYSIYLMLLRFIGYRVSYTVSYVAGILLSFYLNRIFVFQAHRGWRSVALFPFVYIVQYLTGLTLLWLWVAVFKLPRESGPIVAILVTVPLTYVLSRGVFGRKYAGT